MPADAGIFFGAGDLLCAMHAETAAANKASLLHAVVVKAIEVVRKRNVYDSSLLVSLSARYEEGKSVALHLSCAFWLHWCVRNGQRDCPTLIDP